MPESDFSERKASRNVVVMTARCRTMSGIRAEGSIHDLSTHGCNVTMRGLSLAIGTRVMVKPDGLEAITGIVRWSKGTRVGIEFDAPLYPPIVEHLSHTHSPEDAPTGR